MSYSGTDIIAVLHCKLFCWRA